MNNIFNIKEITRSFKRNIESGILSIVGLTIGITIALLIGFWSLNEFSFDKFHNNYENKYRLCRKGFLNNESVLLGSECVPAGKDASEKFPEIESFLRITPLGKQIVALDKQKVFVDNIVATDDNFFNFLDFKLLVGNPDECLKPNDNVIIDEQLAKAWFGNKNAIGQIIEILDQKWTISGIVENTPSNTHLEYKVILPIHGISWISDSKWGERDNMLTYFELKPGTNINQLAKNINNLALSSFPLYKDFSIEHFLQPLANIHFSSNFRFDNAKVMDKRIIFIFISIATLILLIACFNFINLFISTAFLRSKSIGIRKIIGSSKKQLFISSFAETSVYVIITTFVAIILTFLLLPWFNQLTNSSIVFDFTNPSIYIFIGILLLTTIMIAGSVPVLFITRQNPEEIIRFKYKGKNINFLQRSLVIAQFAASIILISSSFIIKKQILYIQTKDLGFDKENIIYLTPRGKFASDYEIIRQELLKSPGIVDVTAKSCLPSDWHNGSPVRSAQNPESKWIMEVCEIKNNYPSMIDIQLVKGENPFDESRNESYDCMINEQAAIALGFDDPIGKEIGLFSLEQKFIIRGILKNANTKSLHRSIDPQVYTKLENFREWQVLMVKANNTQQAIKSLQQLWTRFNPEIPFEYHFLDQVYDNLYQVERTANQIVTIGMVVAIFLAFMGLFAIAHYASLRRVKEVGIRKVNGAKTTEIITLLNRDFIVWVAIAFAIATPVSYYAMSKWLANFAFKTSLSWWIFILSGVISIGIALFTVSWQSLKAASRNPVESLHYE